MAKATWSPDNTITEVELARQARIGAITEMVIEQTHDGYQVLVRLKWYPERIAIRTRRSLDEPRLFKSLERLVAFIRGRFPEVRELGLTLLAPAQPAKRMRKSEAKK